MGQPRLPRRQSRRSPLFRVIRRIGGSAPIKALHDSLLALRRPWNNGGLRPFGTKWTNKLRHAGNGPPSASAWRCLSIPPTALRIYILHGNGIRWRKMRNGSTVCDHSPQRWKPRANPEIHIWQPLVQHFVIAKTLHFLATPQSDDLGGALHAAASSLSLRGLLQCRITPACRSSEVFLVL